MRLLVIIISILLMVSLLLSSRLFITVPFIPYIFPYEKDGIVGLVNNERINHGLRPLKTNILLNKSAELKGKDQIKRNYYGHYTPDNKFFVYFIEEIEYKYVNAGENLARNYYDDKELVDAWMASPAHKKNILDSRWSDVGFARVGKYEVMHFAQK